MRRRDETTTAALFAVLEALRALPPSDRRRILHAAFVFFEAGDLAQLDDQNEEVADGWRSKTLKEIAEEVEGFNGRSRPSP